MRIYFRPAVILFVLILMFGCANLPRSSGTHIDLPYAGSKAVVWGSHSGAVGETVTSLQRIGVRVVERSHLKQVFEEQKMILSNTSEDEGKILKVGKIVGADTIVFVDVQTSSDVVSRASMRGLFRADSQTSTRYHLSVSIRGVDVETGEVLWSGTAHYARGVNNPEAAILYLARTAIARAMCPSGAWNNFSGCDIKKAYGSGWLGILIGKKESTQGRQLIVAGFRPPSAAQQAGIRKGDIILSCDGKTGFQTYPEFIATCKKEAGETIVLGISRGNKTMTVTAIVAQRPAPTVE